MEQVAPRRKYFIDPGFQLSFIARFCAVVLVSSIVIGCAMFLVSRNSTTVAIENTRVIVKPTADFIIYHLAVILLIVAVCASLAVLLLTLFVSHKISGPIFRIKKEIDLMQQGDLTRKFSIRNSDQLQDLARSLELMAQTLRKKHLAIGGQCRSVTNFLEEKNLGGTREDRDKLLQMLKELYEMLAYFKV